MHNFAKNVFLKGLPESNPFKLYVYSTALFFVANLITNKTATVITTPIGKQIQVFPIKGAMRKFTKEIAATVIA